MGIGIVATGLALPALLARDRGWTWACLALALPALIAAVGIAIQIRVPPARAAVDASTSRWLTRSFIRLAGAYFLFGVGHVAMATFLVAYLQVERHFTDRFAGLAWAFVGFGAAPGPLVWGRVADRLGYRPTLAGAYAVLVLALLSPIAVDDRVLVVIGAAVFGATISGITVVSLLSARALAGGQRAPRAIGAMTVCFSVGQAIGPAVAGRVAETTGSLATPFLISAILVAIGGALVIPPFRAG